MIWTSVVHTSIIYYDGALSRGVSHTHSLVGWTAYLCEYSLSKMFYLPMILKMYYDIPKVVRHHVVKVLTWRNLELWLEAFLIFDLWLSYDFSILFDCRIKNSNFNCWLDFGDIDHWHKLWLWSQLDLQWVHVWHPQEPVNSLIEHTPKYFLIYSKE